MKRFFIIAVAILASVVLFPSCGKEESQRSKTAQEVSDTVDYAIGKTQVDAQKNAEKKLKEIEKTQQQKYNDAL